MNRGSEPTSCAYVREGGGFNEAPIHESGKCDRSDQSVQLASSFNEAPIHESGKFAKGDDARIMHVPLQ